MNKHIFPVFVSILIIIGILISGATMLRKKIDTIISAQPSLIASHPSPTPTSIAVTVINQTLFVPYWSLQAGEVLPPYQKLIYFGLQVTEDGIDKADDGYNKLRMFTQNAGNQNKILAIRMIDSKTNFEILKNTTSQDAIIRQSIELARSDGFNGVLLNIEISALPFGSLIDQITAFNDKFVAQAHKAGLSYSLTAYGDTFYRVRPFDIKKLAKQADSVYVMAYDFHKAKGNPGPNFPLHGFSTYGYDYDHLIASFTDAVSPEKLILVFGMYGYDWNVDDKGVAQDSGAPMALNDIKAKIIDHCAYISCEWERDTVSSETKATYHDDSGTHVVWFEDEESVRRKQELLKSRGIGSFAYWAYSYF